MTDRPSNPYKIVRIRRLADRPGRILWLIPTKVPTYELERVETATEEHSTLIGKEAIRFLGTYYHPQDIWDIRSYADADWPASEGRWYDLPNAW